MQFVLEGRRDVVPETPAVWRITGGRPMLAVVGPAPESGWYLVHLDLRPVEVEPADSGGDDAVAVRFLPESGSTALSRRSLPRIGGRRARVVHVPEGTARIEVELSPWSGTVRCEAINLRPLPQAIAASMMAADVAASSVGGTTDGRDLLGRLRGATNARGARAAIEEIAVAYDHLQQRRAGDAVDYPTWRARNAILYDEDIARLRAALDALPGGGPSFSIVMPVHDPEPTGLQEAIESVQTQIHGRWQLCIVDDGSEDPAVHAVLDAAARDPRVIVRRRPTNGHIVAATNDALELASGEWVAFMDHDDLLAPHALALLALDAPDADVLYTDEDKVDALGRHFDPHFKPSWNPELLLGQNYCSHLTAIRRRLVDDVGRMRPGTDGSQDHDLLLRVTALVDADRIVHVPHVLYHWRATAGSTALAPGEKTYTETASIEALRDRLGPGWEIDVAAAPTTYRCTPPLDDVPMVSILIPTRDRLDLVQQCVESVLRTTWPAFEILIIDNDSENPETLEWFDAFDNGLDHRVIRAPGAFNYSTINNTGAAAAHGDLLLLLNNDTEVIDPRWLTEMVRWIGQPGIGAVGAKLLYPDDTIQHAGVVLGLGGFAGHGHHLLGRDEYGYFSRLTMTHEVGAVTGACLLTRRDTWDQLGGLDEELAVAFNDIDYCLRVRHELGQRILWTPHALLYHHESVSRGSEDDPAKVARFNAEVDRCLERWAPVLGDDPAYSPNLALDRDSFTTAREPRLVPPWSDPDAPRGDELLDGRI